MRLKELLVGSKGEETMGLSTLLVSGVHRSESLYPSVMHDDDLRRFIDIGTERTFLYIDDAGL